MKIKRKWFIWRHREFLYTSVRVHALWLPFFKSLQRVWRSGALRGFRLSLLTICSHTGIIHRTESWQDAREETRGSTIKLKIQTLQCFILQSVCIFTFLFSHFFFKAEYSYSVCLTDFWTGWRKDKRDSEVCVASFTIKKLIWDST